MHKHLEVGQTMSGVEVNAWQSAAIAHHATPGFSFTQQTGPPTSTSVEPLKACVTHAQPVKASLTVIAQTFQAEHSEYKPTHSGLSGDQAAHAAASRTRRPRNLRCAQGDSHQ